MRKNRLLAVAAISAALTSGGVAGAVLAAPTVSWGQDGSTTTTTADPGGDRPTEGRNKDCDRGRHHHPRPGLGAAAEALGLEVEELRTRLRGGATIAEVAADEGVEVQTVIDAMVARATEALDRAVANEKLSPERADTVKAELPDRIADLVNDGYRRDRDRPGPGG
jgi:hypothetical protein